MRPGLIALLAGLVLAPAAQAATDRTVTITPAAPTFEWTSTDSSGINPWNQGELVPPAGIKHECTKDPQKYCDTALVHVTADEVSSGTMTFRLEGFQPYSDFDLRVYESDASGAKLSDYITPNGDGNGPAGSNLETFFGDYETSTASVFGDDAGKVDAWFLIEVSYWTVVNDHYTAKVGLSGLEPWPPVEEEF